MEYKFEFGFYYLNADPIKDKHYRILLNSLQNGRYSQLMSFYKPARIDFDSKDKKHQFPTITEMDEFKRKKTNCLIFNLLLSYANDGQYDKLFLYYSDGFKTPYYGYILYNSETNKYSHKYLICGDINDLHRALNNSFVFMRNKKIYDLFKKKYECIQGKNGLTILDCPTEKDFEKILKSA